MSSVEQGSFRSKMVEAGKLASLVTAAAGILISNAPAVFFGAFGFFASDSLKKTHA